MGPRANTGVVGFLKFFHFFPLQPELVATAHIIPVGQGNVQEVRGSAMQNRLSPDLHVN